MDAYDISASAMTAQRLRMDVLASNLANVNTTRKADGTPGAYHRKNVVFTPLLAEQLNGGGFESAQSGLPMKQSSLLTNGPTHVVFQNGTPTLYGGLTQTNNTGAAGVQVSGINEDTQTPTKMVYDPSNPDANKDGYVEMPNINPVTEMVDMISASRAYEANVSAMQASKAMDKSALEI